MSLWAVAACVVILNLPFGFLRARVERFSKKWFLYIHLPIPFVIALRLISGLGFQLYTFPVMIGAYFFGQFAGSIAYRYVNSDG
ncbi:hypothetical protein [Hippea jasoniae]|uniref:hypothetical protein n=1 Tax=Hippea jasoniae TaxID=944479 RepID=UPI00054FA077|nr:hypothetical protein [Hippea jasoniae]